MSIHQKQEWKKLNGYLYVDDGLVAITDLEEFEEFIDDLKSGFKITPKQADYFLGFKIYAFEDGSIKIN